MKKTLSILLVIVSILTLGQPTEITWQQCYGSYGSEFDWPKCIQKTNDGYVIGIDISNDSPYVSNYHGKTDAWTIYLDSLGNIIWERCYGGSQGDVIVKVLRDHLQNFVLFGATSSNDGDVQSNRHGSMWVVKINNEGEILWENTYGGIPPTEDPRDAILTADGGLIMMCRIMGSGGDITHYYGSNDIWVCRIDSIGSIIWENTLGNHALDNAINMILTSNNTLMLVGGHYESGGMIQCPDMGDYGADAWIVEMDMDGNIIRQFCYGGSHNDLIFDIVEINDGYVFVATTNSNDQDVSGFHGIPGVEGTNDIWAVKINRQGEIIWQRCLGGSSSEYPLSIHNKTDSSIIIFGNTRSFDGDISNNHNTTGSFEDIWAIEIDHGGKLLWEHCFGGG